MKKQIRLLMIMIFSLVSFSTAYAIEEEEILGTWINAAGDGQVEISKQGEKYIGTVLGSTDPDSPDRKDINNPDPDLRDRSLQGMQILGDLTFRGDNKWAGGWIYDPNNGKTYKCKMSLKDNNTLKLRGYVGVSVFGRTEEWTRKSANEDT